MYKHCIIDPRTVSDEELERMVDSLPAWRKEQALRFNHRQGRLECALSYSLLSEMLGFQPGFSLGRHGKPEIATEGNDGKRVFFNISHCKRAVAVIVSDVPCGIDVECLGRSKPELVAYCMSEAERMRIEGAEDSDAEFTMLWTRKEALLKLTGEGITDDLKECLASERIKGVTLDSGCDKEKGYAWSVATF